MSKFVRITAGPCPGRAQRAVGQPGRVAEVQRISVEKMAGRHLRIFCHVPLALLSLVHPHFRYRLQDHGRSVAILPSALVVEHFLLGASWAFLVSVGAATCISLSWVPHNGSGAGAISQSPELGDLVGLHPFYQSGLGLRCTSCDLATVPERVIDFATHPQLVQQHRQLSRHRHKRSLLGVLAASFGHLQTPPA
jgi:hypothetical protein